MVSFLEMGIEMEFRQFVTGELAHKYEQYIEVRDDVIVAGTTGNDKIVECLKVGFFVAGAKVQWIEDAIAGDIHKYCYKNNLNLVKHPVIERDVWNGEIRYNLIYTNGGI